MPKLRFILPLLLAACQQWPPAPATNPSPFPELLTCTCSPDLIPIASPSPVSSPTSTPTNTPSNSPTSSPSPDSSPASTACNPDSAGVHFSVYANTKGIINLWTYGATPDKSRPVPGVRVKLTRADGSASISGQGDAQGKLTLSRPSGQENVTIDVSADGYQSLSREASAGTLCENYYVALSPLSPEEQAGTSLAIKKSNFGGKLEVLRKDESSGFYYGLVRTSAELEALAPNLTGLWGGPADEVLAPLRAGLASGQAVAFLSNGSQGLGDPYDLVQRVTATGRKTILATHLDVMLQDPPPPQPVGDRFSYLIEAVLIPGDTETLVFDALPYATGKMGKQRLEVSASAALLPKP